MRTGRMVIAAVLVSVGAAAHGQQYNPGYQSPIPPSPAFLQRTYINQLNGLREDALQRQRNDGGKLSEANRAFIQAKLDRLNSRLRQNLRDLNPYSGY